MARRIYKYVLEGIEPVVSLPPRSGWTTFGAQGNQIVMWREVDPDSETVDTHFLIVPTGGLAPENAWYWDTVQTADGLVWHIYELD